MARNAAVQSAWRGGGSGRGLAIRPGTVCGRCSRSCWRLADLHIHTCLQPEIGQANWRFCEESCIRLIIVADQCLGSCRPNHCHISACMRDHTMCWMQHGDFSCSPQELEHAVWWHQTHQAYLSQHCRPVNSCICICRLRRGSSAEARHELRCALRPASYPWARPLVCPPL